MKYIYYNTYLQFKTLTDLIVIDYPGRDLRFNLIYNLLSIHYNIRMFVLIFVDELSFNYSLTSIFFGINWFEREVWDMFGLFFFNHPDLRRILTDYSFEGHPLRKDFPLTGYFEVFYDDSKKKLLNVSVSLFQDFRYFSFLNPWIVK